jgi:hypothetical protein
MHCAFQTMTDTETVRQTDTVTDLMTVVRT